MASRMLHYVIANEVPNKIAISSHSDSSYFKAQFQDWSEDRNMKGINWSIFEKKYEKELLCDSLYLGYLCHLITDAIWFKRMIDKYVRIHPKKDRIQYIKQGYDDFRNMNFILVKEYKHSLSYIAHSEYCIRRNAILPI